VPAVTLDAALAESPPLDLLRMDAEGSEPQVLRGAEALLRRSPRLRIVTEWSTPMMSTRSDLGTTIAWLGGLGFRFWRIGAAAGLEPVAAEALPGLPSWSWHAKTRCSAASGWPRATGVKGMPRSRNRGGWSPPRITQEWMPGGGYAAAWSSSASGRSGFGPLSRPLAATSRSTSSITAMSAASP
jgi:hypothetical protein